MHRNIMNLSFEIDNQAAKDNFIEKCLNGFGSMNKNDYETAIFGMLLQQKKYKLLSDFQFSILLHTPESKIKRLRYEVSLREYTSPDNDYYKKAFIDLLNNGKFRITDNQRIQFAIHDKLFRLYINDVLMKDGRFADTSFNPNIVTLPYADLEYLLIAFDSKSKDSIEEIKKSIKEAKKEIPETFMESMKKVGVALTKHTVASVAGETVTNLLNEVLKAVKKSINNNNNV